MYNQCLYIFYEDNDPHRLSYPQSRDAIASNDSELKTAVLTVSICAIILISSERLMEKKFCECL